jgi:hypothetical protein
MSGGNDLNLQRCLACESYDAHVRPLSSIRLRVGDRPINDLR